MYMRNIGIQYCTAYYVHVKYSLYTVQHIIYMWNVDILNVQQICTCGIYVYSAEYSENILVVTHFILLLVAIKTMFFR